MVGISSLTGSVADEDAVASGIGSYFRRWRRLGSSRVLCLSLSLGIRFGSFQSCGRKRVEDPAGERIERSVQWWQDLWLHF